MAEGATGITLSTKQQGAYIGQEHFYPQVSPSSEKYTRVE